MKRLLMCAAVISLVWPGLAGAQTAPDFTGTWKMDIARSESPAHQTTVHDPNQQTIPQAEPATVVIAQTPYQVFVATHRDGKTEALRYPFLAANPDGPKPVGTSGSTDAALVSATGDPDAPHPARWDGPTLVTVTVRKVNHFPVSTVERRTLSANGTEMIVETTLRVEHGYSSNGSSGGTKLDKAGQNFVTVKDVYTRTAAK